MLEDAKKLGDHDRYSRALTVSKWDLSLHILLRQSLRKVTEPKLQNYVVLGPQKGLKHSYVPLLGELQSGEMDLSSLCGHNGTGEVPCPTL